MMDTDNKNFYPTPDEIIYKMLEKVDLKYYSSILEPSAGKGHIIKALIHKGYKGSIDFIEPVEEFCSIVKNIKICDERVKSHYNQYSYETKYKYPKYAGSDFLSFETFKRYSLIIMNPPFSNGDKHLLKAINMIQNGGRVICLLNSETLNNPYSNTRKDLLNQLQKYDAEITDLGQVFRYADRKTDVNVSMVDITIPYKEEKTYIFEGLKIEQEQYKDIFTSNNTDIVISEPIQNLVEHYKSEVLAGKRLYIEYGAICKYLNTDEDDDTGNRLHLSVSSFSEYLEMTRYKYWKKLLKQRSFTENMTAGMLKDFETNLNNTRYIEFNYENIYQVAINSIKNAEKSIKQELVELFDKITYQSSYADYNNKIHLFNGWKTNKAYKIDNKFILRVFYQNSCTMDTLEYKDYEIARLIYSIEKAFAWLDYDIKNGVNYNYLQQLIEESIKQGNLKNIETYYFYVTLYKKRHSAFHCKR